MVLELRDKLPADTGKSTPTVSVLSAMEEDVLSALTNLGYQRAAAEKALTAALKNDPINSAKAGSFDAMFRQALAGLSK